MSKIGALLIAFFILAGFQLAVARQPDSEPTPLQYFGLHIHRADQGTAWPSVPFGSWRLWDAYVGWSRLEPERGQWDFSRLDRYVAMASLTRTDLLLPLAVTPPWASARPQEVNAYQPGNAAEPARLADWTNYVEKVGVRYRGRIKNYEIWNEPSDKTHYTGSVEALVKLACEARRVLKAIDPEIRIVSPASAGAGGHVAYLERFLKAGGKDCIDVVAHHFYVPRFGPEAMVPIIRQVREVMQKNGVGHLPLWNTETGWWIANSDGTPEDTRLARGWRRLEQKQEAGEVLQRAFILARAEGVDRFYWYAWDNGNMGLIEPSLGSLKPAAGAWIKAVNQMKGKVVKGCTRSLAGQWSCELMDVDRSVEVFRWDEGDGMKPREGDR